MADPAQQDRATLPYDEFSRTHNCLTAYVRAGEVSKRGVDNLYDPVHYWSTPDDPDDSHRMIGPFPIDLYEYPPPFLVPVRAALAVTDDFTTIRAAWFAFDIAVRDRLARTRAVDRWLRRQARGDADPLILASIPVLSTLQMGNFQLAAYAMAILAMIAIERERPALGGALLVRHPRQGVSRRARDRPARAQAVSRARMDVRVRCGVPARLDPRSAGHRSRRS
jgi:hypothetical protein